MKSKRTKTLNDWWFDFRSSPAHQSNSFTIFPRDTTITTPWKEKPNRHLCQKRKRQKLKRFQIGQRLSIVRACRVSLLSFFLCPRSVFHGYDGHIRKQGAREVGNIFNCRNSPEREHAEEMYINKSEDRQKKSVTWFRASFTRADKAIKKKKEKHRQMDREKRGRRHDPRCGCIRTTHT